MGLLDDLRKSWSQNWQEFGARQQQLLGEMTGEHVRGPNEGLVSLPEILRREKPSPLVGLGAGALGPLALPYLASPSFRRDIDVGAALPGPSAMVVGGGRTAGAVGALRKLTQAEFERNYAAADKYIKRTVSNLDIREDILGDIAVEMLEYNELPAGLVDVAVDDYINKVIVKSVARRAGAAVKGEAARMVDVAGGSADDLAEEVDAVDQVFRGRRGTQEAASAKAAEQQTEALLGAVESGTVEDAATSLPSTLDTEVAPPVRSRFPRDLINKRVVQGKTYEDIFAAQPARSQKKWGTPRMNPHPQEQFRNRIKEAGDIVKESLGLPPDAPLPLMTPQVHLQTIKGVSKDAIQSAINAVADTGGKQSHPPWLRRAATEYIIDGRRPSAIAKRVGHSDPGTFASRLEAITKQVYEKLGVMRPEVKSPAAAFDLGKRVRLPGGKFGKAAAD